MITRTKIVVSIVCGIFGGAAFATEALHVFAVRNAPIVEGRIVARQPIEQYSVPRADLAIRIDGQDAIVHARVQRYMMQQVPDVVRFHYSGDPAREAFLFEHEENPYWITLTFWGIAGLLLAVLVASRQPGRVRRWLGWNSDVVHVAD
jgi:hypothetical protein